MAIPYKNICNAVILRAGLLSDGSPADRETAYSDADIEGKMDSVEVPYSALRQDVLSAEKELAELIANSNNSLYKAALSSRSELLASGDSVPEVDENGLPFIGSISSVYDSATNRPLTEAPKQEIYRFQSIETTRSFFTVPVYYYAFDGDAVITTVPGFYIRGSVWDADARETAFDALGESPLPLSMENLWICKVLANFTQEGWFMTEAQVYANMVASKQADFIEGRVRAFSLPQIGTKTTTINAGKD